jgi:anti-sigma factor RsiW
MTTDEAYERFSAAADGELTAEDRAAFDALLRDDEKLRKEYDEYVKLIGETRQLADTDAPDLLGGVQARLRQRSRGRFYRDRFATRSGSGTLTPILLALGMLLVIAITWLALNFTFFE